MPRVFECPFFKWEEKLRIHCEAGVLDFMSRDGYKDYCDKFCGDALGWKGCTLAQNLGMEYEKGDDIMPRKTERNIDKLRKLEKELRQEREKRRNADLEILRMHKVVDLERKNAALQLAEVSTAADGLLAALALHSGANVGDGVWEVALPVYSPTELCKTYKVETDRQGGTYLVRVEKRDAR